MDDINDYERPIVIFILELLYSLHNCNFLQHYFYFIFQIIYL
jgi:hypothetical protein